MTIDENKLFIRWASRGGARYQAIMEKTVHTLVPSIQCYGFAWVERRYDGYRAQANSISFERARDEVVDFIYVIFDSRRRLKFQVILGSRCLAPPHDWIRSGSVVWRRKEDNKYKWWGPKWWEMRRRKNFMRAVQQVVKIVPMANEFLMTGLSGDNILVR
jgi:hypothetical protein